MSERFYTSIAVSGPNADAAAKSAHAAFTSQPQNEEYPGSWCDAGEFGPCYFDHYCGQGAVRIIAELSGQFPSEVFNLRVDSECGEGLYGTVLVQGGLVIDGRIDCGWDSEAEKPPRPVTVKGSPEQIRQAVKQLDEWKTSDGLEGTNGY